MHITKLNHQFVVSKDNKNNKKISFKSCHMAKIWGDPECRDAIIPLITRELESVPIVRDIFVRQVDAAFASHLDQYTLLDNLSHFLKDLKAEYPVIENSVMAFREKRTTSRAKQIAAILEGHDDIPRNFYLDVGAGLGYITQAIKRQQGWQNAFGIDVFQPPKIEEVQLIQFDGIKIPFAKNMFDMSTLISVLHHAKHPTELLKETYRVLSENGILVVREFDNDKKRGLIHEFTDTFCYKVFFKLDVPLSGKYLTFDEWLKKFNRTGFKLLKKEQEANSLSPFMAVLEPT